jgi:hypothetical protein
MIQGTTSEHDGISELLLYLAYHATCLASTITSYRSSLLAKAKKEEARPAGATSTSYHQPTSSQDGGGTSIILVSNSYYEIVRRQRAEITTIITFVISTTSLFFYEMPVHYYHPPSGCGAGERLAGRLDCLIHQHTVSELEGATMVLIGISPRPLLLMHPDRVEAIVCDSQILPASQTRSVDSYRAISRTRGCSDSPR